MDKDPITAIYGENVFNEEKMMKYLPKPVFKQLKKAMIEGSELNKELADAVAHAMKEWAISKGATHYTHWFQPLNGVTAEKHDSFINPIGIGEMNLEFCGKELMKGEPDASSFPSGGLRSTFEARGYTAWDCTSPAFIKEDGNLKVLAIPTIFCSYNGEALDKKTPLIRSLNAIEKQTIRILRLLGDKETQKINCGVGPEQEYFLIDRKIYNQRQDLRLTGRTLFGCIPPKAQEMEDHYFGAIKAKIANYMKELNEELWKIGINAKTQHNESAPSQYELAPVYCDVNISTDHNQITMEYMRKIARKFDLKCLLHEKPFKGVNGSGKHNNWSLCTDTGKNLFEIGKTPKDIYQFLLFISAVIKAVDENALLLRCASSCTGNDHRLGACEAPPAIVSIFLGTQLTDLVNQMIDVGEIKIVENDKILNFGILSISSIAKDNTDRNRTSPIAFTGNKFEFRFVGSSVSIATINACINTSVAEALCQFADILEKENDINLGIKNLIRETLIKHKRIIFDGNGYSEDWIKEAALRGLPNAKGYVESIHSYTDEKTIKMFEKHQVLNKGELISRAEINYTTYSKIINIEAKTMIDMTNKLYIPAAIKFKTTLANAISSIKSTGLDEDFSIEQDLLHQVSQLLISISKTVKKLNQLLEESKKLVNSKKAFFFYQNITPEMDNLRTYVDTLESISPKEIWPVPSYFELLNSL